MISSLNQSRWWFRQLPNFITAIRIALVPIVLWLLLTQWSSSFGRIVALVVFVTAAATDGLDGGLARRFNIESNIGKLLDPIADKLLLSGSLLVLSWLGVVPWLATWLILGRELAITLFRLAVAKRRVIAANAGGKFKTVVQIVAIAVVILPVSELLPFWGALAQGLIWAATAITIITGFIYLKQVSQK